MKNKVYLGLGSNKGNKLKFITQAIKLINQNSNCSVEKFSSIYETLPFGVEEQANFFNAVAEVNTSFNLNEFHNITKKTELEIGRKKSFRWGPREIDIDILLFNDIIFANDNLIVPHKDLINRDFALKPLHEIKGNFLFPGTTQVVSKEYLNKLKNHIVGVKRVELLN